jgi:probable rRNA maturation factor
MIKTLIKADSKYPLERKRIKKVVEEFFKKMEVENDMEVGVMVVGDRKMKELNRKYLNVEGTTDVLSFSQTEGEEKEKFVEGKNSLYLGDVVVSWPQAIKQAIERNVTVDDEVDFLVQHGLLHLMGIHHD